MGFAAVVLFHVMAMAMSITYLGPLDTALTRRISCLEWRQAKKRKSRSEDDESEEKLGPVDSMDSSEVC